MAAVYKGKLELTKVDGLRADKKRKQIVPFAKPTKAPAPNRSMKTTENTFRGKKY